MKILQKDPVRLVIILLGGMLLRISAVYYVRSLNFYNIRPPNIDSWGYIADNLYFNQKYQDEYGRITAERGPVYPYFLYYLYRIFGRRQTLALCFQALFDAGTGLLIFLISKELFNSSLAALAAAAAWSFYLPEVYLARRLYSEPIFTLIQAGYIYVQIKGFKRPDTKTFILAGFLLGLATLCRPVTQLFPFFILGGLIVIFKGNLRKTSKFFLPFFLFFSLTVFPWAVRNYRLLGAFVPGSTLLGYNLFLNNIALETNGYKIAQNGPQDIKKYLGEHPELIKELREADIGEKDLVMRRAAFKLIIKYPIRYLETCIVRFKRLWFNLGFSAPLQIKDYLLTVANSALIVLSIITVFVFKGEWRKPALPIFLLIVNTHLVYVPVHAVTRFIIPVIPFFLIFACYGLVSILEKMEVLQIPEQGAKDLR